MPDAPGWVRLSGTTAPASGRLRAALLTTYDAPDASLLIEELLPAWLGLETVYTDDGSAQLGYFAELVRALQDLRGRIAIVSSPTSVAGGETPATHGWLWHYVHRFEVGARRDAVQHAKLWMFHRGGTSRADATERLELIVSSANLTRDGLKGQLQAGWRCELPLELRATEVRRRTWGLLVPFLTELGESCGARGSASIAEWVTLLGRAACPAGVTFVASVPGVHTNTTRRGGHAWGAQGLQALWTGRGRRRMTIVVPTVGDWPSKTVERFAGAAGVKVDQIQLAWIANGHRWSDRWTLPTRTATVWRGRREGSAVPIRWGEIANPDERPPWRSPYPEDYGANDPRWPHAKLYECTEGAHRQLLVTSANFSQSAWGVIGQGGTVRIRNFELGVAVRVDHSLGRHLGTRDFTPATTRAAPEERVALQVPWAAAEWTGRLLRVECRLSPDASLEARLSVRAAHQLPKTVAVRWEGTKHCRGRIVWPASRGVPLLVELRSRGGEVHSVAVLDVRRDQNGSPPVCDRFSAEELEMILARLAEARYGYRLPPDDADITQPNFDTGGGGTTNGDYSVTSYVDARRRFAWIDNWRSQYATADVTRRLGIREDGARVLRLWTRRDPAADRALAALPAALAAEELQFWLLRFSR